MTPRTLATVIDALDSQERDLLRMLENFQRPHLRKHNVKLIAHLKKTLDDVHAAQAELETRQV